MSFRDSRRRNFLDRYIDLALKLWLTQAVPPRHIRRLVLARAARPELARQPSQDVPIHVLTRMLPGGYRDIQHRLAIRTQFYGSPFMLGALGLIH